MGMVFEDVEGESDGERPARERQGSGVGSGQSRQATRLTVLERPGRQVDAEGRNEPSHFP